MKSTIYYFSATGNSLYVAKSIGEKNGASLVAMPVAVHEKIVVDESESVGFVFPLHYFGLPPMVSEFINKLDIKSSQYTYAVVTCGFEYISSALYQLRKLLHQKGVELNAGFHLQMISSYIPLSDIPKEEKQQQIFCKADKKMEKVIECIVAKKHKIEAEYCWLPSLLTNNYWRKKLLPNSNRKFYLSSTCISCGICEKVCPVGNVCLVDDKPKWNNNCQECLACLHFCPKQCIEYGNKTDGRKRYHHPKITTQAIILGKK